jgi:hypothetical protein
VAQTMNTPASKCKNDKIKGERKKWLFLLMNCFYIKKKESLLYN